MASSKQYGPGVIAQSFIKQYYEKLARNPQDLHKFYKENSFFTYVDGVQDCDPVSGPEDIKNSVGKVPFVGCRVDLSEGSLDAQNSDGGVLIVVTGDIVFPGVAARQFVQTFFLDAQQVGPNPSYYVRNSVLRLLRQHSNQAVESSTQPEEVAADSKNEAPETITEPVVEVVEVAADPVEEPVQAEPEAEVEEVAAPVAENTVEVSVDASATVEAAVSASEQPSVVNSGPLSYRDMLKGSVAKVAAPAPAPAPKKKPAPKAAAAPAAATAATASSTPAVAAAGASEAAAPAKYVVYVKLPDSTTTDELRAIFAPFGNVVHCDVLNAKGYAFIGMDTPAGLAAVLASSGTLTLRGLPLSVEERNASAGKNRNKDGNKRNYSKDNNKQSSSSAASSGEKESKENNKTARTRDNNGSKEKTDSDRPRNNNRNNNNGKTNGASKGAEDKAAAPKR